MIQYYQYGKKCDLCVLYMTTSTHTYTYTRTDTHMIFIYLSTCDNHCDIQEIQFWRVVEDYAW